jgi:hypothetical protein
MELEIFNRENCSQIGAKGGPTINFTEAGNVRISLTAKLKTGLQAGDKIELAFAKNENQWYLNVSQNDKGFELRKSGKNDKALQFNSSAITKLVREGFECNLQNSVIATVGASVEFNSKTFWPLLMKRKVVRP